MPVVLPEPGGAARITVRLSCKAARSSGRIAKMGSAGWVVNDLTKKNVHHGQKNTRTKMPRCLQLLNVSKGLVYNRRNQGIFKYRCSGDKVFCKGITDMDSRRMIMKISITYCTI